MQGEGVARMRIAALDIGGTAIKHGIWDGMGLLDFGQCGSVAAEGAQALMGQVEEVLRGMQPFDAIGVSTAGEVDTRTGTICGANRNIPGYLGLDVAAALRGAFGVPVAVENDANAAAVGELSYGAMRGIPDFIYVTYGTGVGGAVVMDGRLRHGSGFSAGSFGGIVVHPERLDACDLLAGRYESYASTSALVRRAQRVDPAIDSGLAAFAAKDDPAVRAELRAWAHEVAIGLVSLVYAFSPEAVVLGGGVMQQPGLVEAVARKAKGLADPRFEGVSIVRSDLGSRAGVLGAAHLAQRLLRGVADQGR